MTVIKKPTINVPTAPSRGAQREATQAVSPSDDTQVSDDQVVEAQEATSQSLDIDTNDVQVDVSKDTEPSGTAGSDTQSTFSNRFGKSRRKAQKLPEDVDLDIVNIKLMTNEMVPSNWVIEPLPESNLCNFRCSTSGREFQTTIRTFNEMMKQVGLR